MAMNSPIQGTAADIIKIAMNRVYRRLKEEGLKSRLVLQVHDELLIETYKEEIEAGFCNPGGRDEGGCESFRRTGSGYASGE